MKKLILLSIILIVGCDNSTEPTDCAGVTNGVASEDDCGVCAGGTTGVVANSDKDCAGVCNGETTDEQCYACEVTLSGTFDCAGVCNGDAVEDCAGECGGSAVLSGCDNACNSTAAVDCDGVCGGSNTNCSAAGTYTMTTYIGYDSASCSGQGYNKLPTNPDANLTLTLIIDGSVISDFSDGGETDLETGTWTQSGNIVTILLFGDDPVPFTLSGNTLTAQMTYEYMGEHCDYVIFTKQ